MVGAINLVVVQDGFEYYVGQFVFWRPEIILFF